MRYYMMSGKHIKSRMLFFRSITEFFFRLWQYIKKLAKLNQINFSKVRKKT